LNAASESRYAALGLRFRALCTDLLVCVGVFLIGSLAAGIVFEQYPSARIVAFILIFAFILGYEPLMVARFGGTFGHQKANIRISCARTNANLPFWRASIRSLVKQVVGLLSFFFMFLTEKGQSLQDLIAGAVVTIRDPLVARPEDYFVPKIKPTDRRTSPIRRIAVTVLYNLVLLVLMGLALRGVSPECIEQNLCVGSEDLVFSIVGVGWVILSIASIILGWTGRLPGCRYRGPS